jgi:uncharacterized pyridoxamine 5'-phosphate oxidase family protein
MYKQLQQSPYVSYCVNDENDDAPVVSINGKVVFEENPKVKSRLWNGNENS